MADKTISEINTSNNLPSPTGNEVVVAYDPDNPSASVGIVLSALPVSSPTQTALNGKANTSHTHAIADVTDLQSTLDGKVDAAAIGAAIDDLIDGAPTELNTLNELAAAIGDDPNYSTTVTNALAGKAGTTHTHIAADVTDFDTGVSNNTDVAANTAVRHTHANKALLDTYTQTEANLDDAVAKKHEHLNQAVLDATTASFLAADETKLDGIEALADVTDATNVDAAGAVMNTDTSTASMSFVIDEDSMASDSATKVPTQQSVKAYVDANAGGIADPGSNGILARTALNTTTARTLTGTTNQVSITNGDGVSGNPKFSLPQNIHTAATPTFGGLTLNASTGLNISGAAGTDRVALFQTTGSTRWNVYANATAEAGSNTGSNLSIARYSDAGAFIATALMINRSSGEATFDGNVRPASDSTYNNGSSVRYWANGYFDRVFLNATSSLDGATAGRALLTSTLSASSGTESSLNIATTVAGSGTQGYSILDMNVTETSTGSGTKLLANLKVGGSTMFSVSNTGVGTFAGDVTVPDEAYGAGWNGSLEVPTKNALYDKIETLGGGSGITRTVVVTSGNATAGATASTDYVYIIAGAHVVTMPTAVGNTNRYSFKNTHSANVSLAFDGAETADGGGITLAPLEAVDLISNGTNWSIF